MSLEASTGSRASSRTTALIAGLPPGSIADIPFFAGSPGKLLRKRLQWAGIAASLLFPFLRRVPLPGWDWLPFGRRAGGRVLFLALAAVASMVAAPARAQNDYSFYVDFGQLPAGSPFQSAQQKYVFNDPHAHYIDNWDTYGNLWQVIDCQQGTSGRCLQMLYPKGGVGAAIGVPGYGQSIFRETIDARRVYDVIRDIYFVPGFDGLPGGPSAGSLGKTPPMIGIGTGMSDPNGWKSLRAMWYGDGPSTSWTSCCHWSLYLDNRKNGTLIVKTATPPKSIVADHWYRIHSQLGPTWAKIWVDDGSGPTLWLDGENLSNATTAGRALIEFSYFFGGGRDLTCSACAKADSYILMTNIEIAGSAAGLAP